MFQILNFDNWSVYDGYAEGSGRGKKTWLINKETGQIGLFKYPKIHSDGETLTTEYISEHLAYQIGKLINIETAVIDIGYYNNDLGCISYDIINDHENSFIIEGNVFLSNKYPLYDKESFCNQEDNKYYNINQIIESAPIADCMPIYKMLILDFIIGNSDRHHNNYAFIKNEITDRYTFCPLYDNGSSLCCRITDDEALKYIGKDKLRLKSLIDTKSKSFISIDGSKIKSNTHAQMVQYIFSQNGKIGAFANDVIRLLNANSISNLLSQYPSNVLTENKRNLIYIYLKEKTKLLSDILENIYGK